LNGKKEYEGSCFELFCELYFGHTISYKQFDPPHPDVSATIDGKNTGIELTTIYSDNIIGRSESQLKKNESLQSKICSYIQDALIARLDYPVEVQIVFDNTKINGKDVIPIGNWILEQLQPLFSDSLPNEEILLDVTDPERLQSPVYRISAAHSPDFEATFVTGTIASFNKTLSLERIRAAIEDKDNKIDKYKDLYDHKWLILCIETDRLSSDFNLSESPNLSVGTGFHHVFLLQYRSKRLFIIK
jgi:hypothetical protein